MSCDYDRLHKRKQLNPNRHMPFQIFVAASNLLFRSFCHTFGFEGPLDDPLHFRVAILLNGKARGKQKIPRVQAVMQWTIHNCIGTWVVHGKKHGDVPLLC